VVILLTSLFTDIVNCIKESTKVLKGTNFTNLIESG
jgi:hypothetical protein